MEMLGVGGFGSVKKYFNKKTSKFIAVKSINLCDHLQKYQNLKTIENEIEILEEVQFLRHISHKTISYFFEFLGIFRDNDNPNSINLVQESGECSLDKIFFNRKRTNSLYKCEEILYIVNKIVKAMAILQENRIVHLDLKPPNIIYSNNKYKVTDFGISRKIPHNIDKISGALPFTLVYAAPEVILQQKKPFNPFKSDAFSLGISILTAFFPGNKLTARFPAKREYKINKRKKEVRRWENFKPLSDFLELILIPENEMRKDFIELREILKEIKKKIQFKPPEEEKFYEKFRLIKKKTEIRKYEEIETILGLYQIFLNYYLISAHYEGKYYYEQVIAESRKFLNDEKTNHKEILFFLKKFINNTLKRVNSLFFDSKLAGNYDISLLYPLYNKVFPKFSLNFLENK